MSTSTPSLLEEFGADRKRLVDRLYAKWHPKISYQQAEDFIADAFVEALEKASAFEGCSQAEISSYIHIAASRDVTDFMRSPASRRTTKEISEFELVDRDANAGEDDLEQREMRKVMLEFRELTTKLPVRSQQVLNLLFDRDLSWNECAKELGISRQRFQRERKGALLKARVALAASTPTDQCGGFRERIKSKVLDHTDRARLEIHLSCCIPCRAYQRERAYVGRLGAMLPLPVLGWIFRISDRFSRQSVQGGKVPSAGSNSGFFGSGAVKVTAISCVAVCAAFVGSYIGAKDNQKAGRAQVVPAPPELPQPSIVQKRFHQPNGLSKQRPRRTNKPKHSYQISSKTPSKHVPLLPTRTKMAPPPAKLAHSKVPPKRKPSQPKDDSDCCTIDDWQK